MGEREYVLGTDEVERQRLGLQHRLWSDAAHALWRRAGVRPGMTVVDLGCGPGFTTVDLARLVGERGRVIGVDASARFIEYVNRQAAAQDMPWMEGRVGDVTRLGEVLADLFGNGVDGGSGAVDVVYGRWVLCFVDDPAAVVRDSARLLRAGGVLATQEYFNYGAMSLMPREAAFSAVVAAIKASWSAGGGDADIAGRLPGMMRDAGLAVGEVVGHARTARMGEQMWAWPDSFWVSVLPRLVEGGFLTAAEAEAFIACWERARGDGSVLALPTVYDVVGRRMGA